MNTITRQSPRPLLIVLPLVTLLIGLALGWWLARNGDATGTTASQASAKAEPEVLYWYDPMVPDQHFDKPGKSPFMDMDLVPKYADEGAGDDRDDGIRINPRLTQNLGMRSVAVQRGVLDDAIEAIGVIAFDEDRLVRVSAPADAILERLHRRDVLMPVNRGEPLARLLAPDWVSAQGEYLSLLRLKVAHGGDGIDSLRAAARQRLQVLGMPEAAIRRLESRREADASVTLTAPVSGVIRSLDAAEGDNLRRGDPLFGINPLDTVWIDAELDAADAGRIEPSASASLSVDALPGRRFDVRILAVLPAVDGSTRRQRLRLVADNSDGLLAPGQFARIRIAGDAREGLLLPNEALIVTGRRRAVVISDGDGRFRVAEVQTGPSDDRHTLVLDGLSAGDRVVTSGQFLIDSEASLRQQVQRLDDGEGEDEGESATKDGDHESMDHAPTDNGSMNHGLMNHGSMNHGSMNHAPTDNGSMNHAPTDNGSMNHAPTDNGSMDHGSMDRGSMNHASMDHASMNHQSRNKASMASDSMDHGAMNHDAMGHDGQKAGAADGDRGP